MNWVEIVMKQVYGSFILFQNFRHTFYWLLSWADQFSVALNHITHTFFEVDICVHVFHFFKNFKFFFLRLFLRFGIYVCMCIRFLFDCYWRFSLLYYLWWTFFQISTPYHIYYLVVSMYTTLCGNSKMN